MPNSFHSLIVRTPGFENYYALIAHDKTWQDISFSKISKWGKPYIYLTNIYFLLKN